MSSFKLYNIMSFSKLIYIDKEAILCGVPPRVSRVLQENHFLSPTIIILTDQLTANNNPQNNLELLLRDSFFLQKIIESQKKIKIIGQEKILENNRKLLKLISKGFNETQYLHLDLPEDVIKIFLKEQNYFLSNHKKKNIFNLEDYIEFCPFNSVNLIEIDNTLSIRHIGYNEYELIYNQETLVCSLNPNEFKEALYEPRLNYKSRELKEFSVELIKQENSSSQKSCARASLIVSYNGSYILINSSFYLESYLYALGIAKNEISGIFLSNSYDECSNLIPFIFSSRKVKVITTYEIYWIVIYKTSLVLNKKMKEVFQYFEFVPLKVGKVLNYYGLHIRPYYSINETPSIGAKFFFFRKNKEFSFIYTNNRNMKELKEMKKKAFLSQDRLDKIKAIYEEKTNYLFINEEEAFIYDEFKIQADQVIFSNLDRTEKEYPSHFLGGSKEDVYTIYSAEKSRILISKLASYLNIHFQKLSSLWLSTFLTNMEILYYNRKDIILLEENNQEEDIYLIISGSCSVTVDDLEKKTKVTSIREAGSIIYGLPLPEKEDSKPFIVANSSVIICRIAGSIVRTFIYQEQKKQFYLQYGVIQDFLSKIPFFKNISKISTDILASHFEILRYSKENYLRLDEEIALIIPLEGVLEFQDENSHYYFEYGDCLFYPSYFYLKTFGLNKKSLFFKLSEKTYIPINQGKEDRLDKINLLDDFDLHKDPLLEYKTEGHFFTQDEFIFLSISKKSFRAILEKNPDILFLFNTKENFFYYFSNYKLKK